MIINYFFPFSKPELLRGVYAMGYNTPSKIQETALPTLIADPPQNMIAQSQSGTGKTGKVSIKVRICGQVKTFAFQLPSLSPC